MTANLLQLHLRMERMPKRKMLRARRSLTRLPMLESRLSPLGLKRKKRLKPSSV